MPALTRRSYDKFIIPVEKTDYMSIDYYRGIMFVCNGFQVFRINPTTNKVMGVTDLDVINPVIDIDVENQSSFYGICLGEKRIKRIDAYTGKVLADIIVDRYVTDSMIPFKLHSTMTKAPDGFYFIDGFFNATLKTNRIVKYDPISRTSDIVREVTAANYNDLEFDDIGLLRLTDVKGVIERYNIIPSSPAYSTQIDEIPVGDPFPLREEIINPPPSALDPAQIAPPDISYFLEQPFAALTLEPNWEFKNCPDPLEWQIALNPCIHQLEQNINFIKDINYQEPTVDFVDEVVVNSNSLIITLNPSFNYENVRIDVTDPKGEIQGSATNVANIYTFTFKDPLGDRALAPFSLEFNHKYHLEIAVVFDTDILTQTYHSFNLDFSVNSFPTTLQAPFTPPAGLISISGYDNSPLDPSVFNQQVALSDPVSGSLQLVLDAMEENQYDSYDKQQEMLFLYAEKENLLRVRRQLQDLKDIKDARKQLLKDYNTSEFPYNFQLAHFDKVITEYKTMLGSNTLNKVNKRLDWIDQRYEYLKNYAVTLEEILRAAEFPCRTPRLFATQYNQNASEEYEVETAGQTIFNLTNATYTPGSGDLVVYVNDIPNIDYVETDESTVTFNNGLNIGDIVRFVFYPVLDPENIMVPAEGGSVLLADPIINRVEFPEVLDVAVGVQSPINLNLFKVYDVFEREIDLYDLDPFYFELPENDIVELRINDTEYFLFGLQDGSTELILHLANTSFKIPLNIETGITPSVFVPFACTPKPKKEDYLWKLVFEDLTLCVPPEKPMSHIREPESHLVVQGITNTGTRQVDPGHWALMFEGTMILPDVYHEGIILEYAQLNQEVEINDSTPALVLDPIVITEMPIVLENTLETDILLENKEELRLSPTAFDRDLILQESLEFDPALPEINPIVLQQGIDTLNQAGPLQMEFICTDVPADDEENTIILQGNSGGRHPVKITWDGDYCYVLYAGECSAELIDLKSIFRKVFISSPDPEIYGLGLHSTNIFAQARDLEGQEFALAKTKSKAIAFIDTFTEFLNAQNPDADSSVPKITVSTDGLIYGPGTITLDEGVIFNYHNDSGITLDPGKSITISFNTFKLLEGLTYLARTSNPLQKIILETSNDGVNFLESDTTFISKTSLSVFELNQFSVGVESNKVTTNVRLRAPEENTAPVDIALINLFHEEDRFNRESLPLQQVGVSDPKSLIVANQSLGQPLDFVFSPDPLNFLNQTVAAPINPLVSTPLKNVLESSSLVVTGLPAAGLLPTVFTGDSEFNAIAPISPITDIRGNSELIYRAGLMYAFENKVLNSDWHWGLLNWDIVNNPIISFETSTISNQITITRPVDFQERTSGIVSKVFQGLPVTDYYVTFEGIDLTGEELGFVKLDYYDVRGDFISSTAPIPLKDTFTVVSSKKTSPEFTHFIKVSVLIEERALRTNPTTTDDIIKMNWLAITANPITEFSPYENNLDVIKIMIET